MQKRSRTSFILWLPLLLCITTPHLACRPTTANDRPNVILCMGDDHGWDETGYNGHPYLHTPVLDEMAAAGLRLDRFYSASPVCSPTRGSVMTGRHPNRYGTFTPNWSIRPEEITIAQLLSRAGYACAHFGKWHLGPVKTESPTNPGAMGFHEWLSHDNFFEMNPYLSRNGGPPEQFEGESSEILIDETIRFIGQTQAGNKPFFAVVWFGSPHEPYSGLEKDLALYDDLLDKFPGREVTLTSMETGRPVKRPQGAVLRERYAEITAMDRSIGTLRDYLDEAGLRNNTLLWYCGDNGVPSTASLTTPLRGEKGMMYEGGIRVPGIIEWPDRITRPRATRLNSVTSDMLPTICDVVGIPLPDRPLDGISLVPLIDGLLEERPEPIFFWTYDTSRLAGLDLQPYIDPELQAGTTPLVKMLAGRYTRNFQNVHHPEITQQDYAGPRAILAGRFKLVINGDGEEATATELFDLRSEQSEQTNLTATNPETAKNLADQLHQWQTSVLESLTGADYPQ
ncbi:MAG: N-acetylgalactosamine-6-sulfatase [Planctomycetota bacterium]|nr:MAG: N-acetylgalactosamine-6-sulfatase [Planctomycetota bacterium]